MKKICKITIFLLSLSFLAACATQNYVSVPDWIDNPGRHQAVGSCGSHAKGKFQQQQTAEKRARLELAARDGIEIKSMSLMTEKVNNSRSSSSLNQQTTQKVNTKIKARVVDSFHDKVSDIYWVLVEST
jgi:hypothetical protein